MRSFLAALLATCAFSPDLWAQTPEKIDYVKDIKPIIAKFCVTCHGGPKPKGELSLEFADLAAAAKDRKLWEKVAHQIRTNEMPPASRPKPSLDQLDLLNTWIDRDMLAVDCKSKRDPGRVTLRRLNKSEYNNTIRDLLGLSAKLSDDFPSDDVGYGFDNIGDVLTLSPLLLEKYLAAAEKAAEMVFADFKLRGRIMIKPPEKLNKNERTRHILGAFAKRAYRRPVSDEEVDKLAKFVDLAERAGQTYERGMQLAVQAALVSPHFLFRVENDPKTGAETPGLVKEAYRINEFELASRLSYFLWSSMPDDELFRLAEKNELRKDDNLDKQVLRMLKDGKVRALTENFAGQWLNLRLVRESQPDPKLFPSFTEGLRLSMIEETYRFFDTIVKEDRNILDFIDADFTFVDETLARHYGIFGVKGTEFRKVKLDDKRGGILTHASILTLTSNPNRTSPVKRGKWILENIFNSPPPPPVPDAGELPEDEKELKGTLRQRMELHRANPACATCHQRMDPLGFAFENYDAIGRWRDRDGKFDIDASGELPGGRKFKGAKELKAILKERDAEFRRCLAEKLTTFALGRGLEYYDKCAIDGICAAVARADNRFSSLVLAIVQSEPFQYRKAKGSTKK